MTEVKSWCWHLCLFFLPENKIILWMEKKGLNSSLNVAEKTYARKESKGWELVTSWTRCWKEGSFVMVLWVGFVLPAASSSFLSVLGYNIISSCALMSTRLPLFPSFTISGSVTTSKTPPSLWLFTKYHTNPLSMCCVWIPQPTSKSTWLVSYESDCEPNNKVVLR